jgi:hypothetical protein
MGFDVLLVVVDRAKKQMHAIPTTVETSALGLAKLYQDNVWRYHGLPDSIILDRGPQFTAELMKELNKLLGIQTKLSMAYHPQTDSQTERMNQEIKQYLRLFVSHWQHDWPEWVAIAEFSYNNKIHTLIKVSSFFDNYSFNPRMGVEPTRQTKVEAVDDFTKQMKFIHEEAQVALTKAKEDFEMIHKPGASMGKADALSRRPDHKEGVENDNKEVMLLKPEVFAIRSLQQGHLVINGAEDDKVLSVFQVTSTFQQVVVGSSCSIGTCRIHQPSQIRI